MQYKQTINLREYYDFSKPGKYAVSLKLEGFKDFHKSGKEDVISSKATIVIK